MEFREVAGGRSVRRPELDEEGLADTPAAFQAEFSFDEVRIVGGEQPGVIGEGMLHRCLVSGVDLSQSCLSDLELCDTRLERLDLSNAALRASTVRHAELMTCRGIGLRLTVEQASDFYIEDCLLDYAAIEITKIKGLAVFHRCSFREATFAGNLSDAVFSECDFAGAEFRVQRAERCDLSGSRLVGARRLSSLRGAQITRDQAVSVADVLATEAGLVVST